jgi:hypothetical protein
MSSKIQLTGGNFQDVQGNALANGYLLMELSQDASVASPASQIAAGYIVKITLNSSGSVDTTTPQYVWPNDVLSPTNTFYNVTGYSSKGELVWGPNPEQVLSSPNPYDIGAWQPNVVSVAAPRLSTNYDVGVFFPSTFANGQTILLLKMDRTVTYAASLTPSTAVCGTNPTDTATFTLNKISGGVTTAFGTIVFNTAGVPTITSSGTTFNSGDSLQIVAQATADLTLADVGIILSGTTSA